MITGLKGQDSGKIGFSLFLGSAITSSWSG